MTYHPWFQYFGIEPFNRTFNPFNLADIYLQTGGIDGTKNYLEIKTESNDLAAANKLLSAEGVGVNDSIIAFQAGSSLKGRRWSPKSFARLGDLLSKNLGSKII